MASLAAMGLGARAMVQCRPLAASAQRTHYMAFRSTRCMASVAPSDQPKVNTTASEYYVLQYSYVPDVMEKRGPHRDGHLAAIKEWNQKGKLILAGALVEPVDGGLLVFKGTSVEEIESFVAADPYVQNGIVADSSVRPLATVCAP